MPSTSQIDLLFAVLVALDGFLFVGCVILLFFAIHTLSSAAFFENDGPVLTAMLISLGFHITEYALYHQNSNNWEFFEAVGTAAFITAGIFLIRQWMKLAIILRKIRRLSSFKDIKQAKVFHKKIDIGFGIALFVDWTIMIVTLILLRRGKGDIIETNLYFAFNLVAFSAGIIATISALVMMRKSLLKGLTATSSDLEMIQTRVQRSGIIFTTTFLVSFTVVLSIVTVQCVRFNTHTLEDHVTEREIYELLEAFFGDTVPCAVILVMLFLKNKRIKKQKNVETEFSLEESVIGGVFAQSKNDL